jgi:hypothetical protein
LAATRWQQKSSMLGESIQDMMSTWNSGMKN